MATFVHSFECFKTQRYQQKALDAGNKINVGIELKFSVQKLQQLLAYHQISTQCLWQLMDASR